MNAKTVVSLGLMATVSFVTTAGKAPAFSIEEAIQSWEQIPENAQMEASCAPQLKYSMTVNSMVSSGTPLTVILRWAEQEAERSAADLPTEPLLPIGTQLLLTKLIRRAYSDAPIYQQIPGGFPQWVYRSCLKGKMVD